ncbi:MAG: PilT/PilU family type 4a pilus ATPase [Oscillospiraceae bacterium]|nr:PilT/PilU family type 4a pilus ATPase [Oscillospiraceae bacterium]
MELLSILKNATEKSASDIFIIGGAPLSFKAHGVISRFDDEILTTTQTEVLVRDIFAMANIAVDEGKLPEREMDFSFSVSGMGRFRANIYKQRGSYAAVLRFVPFELPDATKLGIPEQVMEFSKCKGGIVLITGAASNGKSTTLSCIINRINSTQNNHIITIEDPIEFLHRHDKSIISQREINLDTNSYLDALRSALRQSPDVILLGEMRDYETISVAMTAAETGQLVLSTLHTLGAASTIDRIIDVFPINQQRQIRIQLSMTLKGVVSQQLLPSVDGTLVPAFEIMSMNSAIKTMIREEKTHQIDTILQSSPGMQTMDSCILDMYRNGTITAETAVEYAYNPEIMKKRVAYF